MRAAIDRCQRTMVLGILLLALGCQAKTPPPTGFRAGADSSWNVHPGLRVGPIGAGTSEEELLALFGESALRDTVYVAEGLCLDGTTVFAGTPDELGIAWSDSQRTAPAFVRIQGDSTSRWRTASGVGIGTPLDTLVALRRGPIAFSGFGWDYGGAAGWHEPGTSDDQTFGLELDIETHFPQDTPGIDDLYGERTVRSDHPLLAGARVRVRSMIQGWAGHFREFECLGDPQSTTTP